MMYGLLFMNFEHTYNSNSQPTADAIFPDSKTTKKYSGSQTKTTHICSWAVSKVSIFNLKSTLILSSSDLYV